MMLATMSFGAVHGAIVGHDPYVIYYASKTLDCSKQKYSTTKKIIV